MLPILDLQKDPDAAAEALAQACRAHGFFYVTGHGVPADVQTRLEQEAKAFFDLPTPEKMRLHMARGGRAWRGYFPVGEELTSGKPDLKEGLYFGEELGPDDPRVQARWPMHGPNLFPEHPAALREAVLEYMAALTALGHRLMALLSQSLGLPPDYIHDRHTAHPLTLFRVFHYPPTAAEQDDAWGVGEHTDYGVLTILKQDDAGGLQVHSDGRWLDAPPLPGTFVCNIGDMLERMTRGRYRSTPHRVRNTSGRSRFSYPFFFDPAFDAPVVPLPLPAADGTLPPGRPRWDGADPHAFDGTYGDYLLGKVAQVFPQLRRDIR